MPQRDSPLRRFVTSNRFCTTGIAKTVMLWLPFSLNQAGCDKIYTDTLSGAKASRPGLDECLSYARQGDTIVVWKLDRLGRSLKHLIETVQALDERGIGFKSVQESIDTTALGGKLVFDVVGALAEFERDLIRERTNAGVAAARATGRRAGASRFWMQAA